MGGAEQQSQRKQIGDIMVYTRRKLTPRLRAVGCKNNDDVEEKEDVRKIDDDKDDQHDDDERGNDLITRRKVNPQKQFFYNRTSFTNDKLEYECFSACDTESRN